MPIAVQPLETTVGNNRYLKWRVKSSTVAVTGEDNTFALQHAPAYTTPPTNSVTTADGNYLSPFSTQGTVNPNYCGDIWCTAINPEVNPNIAAVGVQPGSACAAHPQYVASASTMSKAVDHDEAVTFKVTMAHVAGMDLTVVINVITAGRFVGVPGTMVIPAGQQVGFYTTHITPNALIKGDAALVFKYHSRQVGVVRIKN
ncbi:MAG: hypothetical protein ACAH95_05750 [Fimbriimonas sp.]